MPRKHHKKRNYFKKESVIEGLRRLEITENKESKVNDYLGSDDIQRSRCLGLQRCASENSLKIHSESLMQFSTRSEPSLHETVALRDGVPITRRNCKKLRFSHEVLVMCYHNNRPTIKQIQPLADERDQQKRSYRYRSIRKPFDAVYWTNA